MYYKVTSIFRNTNIETILKGCQKGNRQYQKMLYETYFGLAKRICARYAGSSEETEEMINDGFLKIFTKLDQYDFNQPFEAWFRTLITRNSIDYYRKYKNKFEKDDLELHPHLEQNTYIIDELSADDILSLVQKLPPAYRVVFSMYVIEGYSHAEIAQILNINEGTSRSNLVKARLKLQDWVKKLHNEVNHKDNGFF